MKKINCAQNARIECDKSGKYSTKNEPELILPNIPTSKPIPHTSDPLTAVWLKGPPGVPYISVPTSASIVTCIATGKRTVVSLQSELRDTYICQRFRLICPRMSIRH